MGHEGSLKYLDFNFHQPVDLKAGGWRESVLLKSSFAASCISWFKYMHVCVHLHYLIVMKHILVTQQIINYNIVYDQ